MRTTTPALSSSGTLARKRDASRGLQRSGWKISPASTIGFSQAQCSAARCTGSSSDSSLLAVGRPGVFAQGLAQRQVLRLRLRRQLRRVGGHEGEGRVGVATVLRQVEMHAADQVPGRVQALQKALQIGLATRPGLAHRPPPVSSHSARSTSGSDIRRPAIIGAVSTSEAQLAGVRRRHIGRRHRASGARRMQAQRRNIARRESAPPDEGGRQESGRLPRRRVAAARARCRERKRRSAARRWGRRLAARPRQLPPEVGHAVSIADRDAMGRNSRGMRSSTGATYQSLALCRWHNQVKQDG